MHRSDDMTSQLASNVDLQKQSETLSKKLVKKKQPTFDSDDDSQDAIGSPLDTNLRIVTRQKTKRRRRY